MRETWVWSLSWEDPLEKGKATHSSILAWRILWAVQSMGLQRVRHDWVPFTSLTFHWVYGPQHPYLFIFWWTSRFLPCPSYCKQCCNGHRGHVSLSILVSLVFMHSYGNTGSYGSSISSFLRNLHTVLHSGYTRDHDISSQHFIANRWENSGQWETLFWGAPKITADGNCSYEIKRCLLLGRKAMTNVESMLKSRDITLPTKVNLVKAMVFPIVMCGCESWNIKKAEHWRIDTFEL